MSNHPAIAVVTGHSRGLGAAVAQELLNRGIRVLGLARGTNEQLAARHPDLFTARQLDLADAAALTDWLRTDVLRQFLESADSVMLVNNAGMLQPVGPLESQEPALIARAVTVNVAAALMLSAGFVAASADARDRRILHVSSGAARHAYAGWSIYCATKAALDQHAQAVALDDSAGLRIGSVAPGIIDTDMQAEIRAESDELFPDRARFVALKNEGRLLTPERAGRALVDFLLSAQFGAEPVTDLRYS